MSRRIALLAVLGTLLAAGNAQAAAPGGAIPALLPQLVPPRLLTEVGKPVPPPPIFDASFTVPASHGDKVQVFTYGSAVVAEVMHYDRRTFSLAAYLARGVAVPRRLQATFGHLGKISMRFRPPRDHRVESICRFGERLSRQRGTYVGHFSFKGENGYVKLNLHRAKGSIITPAGRCPRRHLTRAEVEKLIESFFEPVSGLFASSREGVTTTSVFGLQRKHKTRFVASREETHGRMAIIRLVFVNGDKGKGIHINEAVTAASLAPPPPFHGTGRYRAAPDGTTAWTGPLSINFLGAPRFPLTGPNFEAQVAPPF